MMTSVFLSLIYLFFPLLCYFVYVFYSKTIYEKEKVVFFDLTLFSSYYLCSKFGNLSLITSFLINIPFIIALYKKRIGSSIILGFVISIYLSNIFNVNMCIFIINYLIIFAISFFTNFKLSNIFTIVNFIFELLIIIFFQNKVVNFNMLKYFIAVGIITYFLFRFIILLYSKIEVIVKMYHSLEEITKEKTLYESLFKITHEIKNPLAVCKGYLDMIDIKNPSKANKYIGIIDQEIDRTLVLLKDFSNVSKIKV